MIIKICLFDFIISQTMEEEIPQKSKTEIEDRIHFLKDREAVLRKDYDKCIAWRVRVVFYSF